MLCFFFFCHESHFFLVANRVYFSSRITIFCFRQEWCFVYLFLCPSFSWVCFVACTRTLSASGYTWIYPEYNQNNWVWLRVYLICTDFLSLVVMPFFFGCIDWEISTAGGPSVFFSCTKLTSSSDFTLRLPTSELMNASEGGPCIPNVLFINTTTVRALSKAYLLQRVESFFLLCCWMMLVSVAPWVRHL